MFIGIEALFIQNNLGEEKNICCYREGLAAVHNIQQV